MGWKLLLTDLMTHLPSPGGGLSRGAVVGDDVNSSAPLGIHVLFFVMF